MEAASRCLADDGVFLLHTIGSNESGVSCDEWIERYIFPRGALPSVRQIADASEDLFVMEDWHNFGPHYDTTLMCWLANFRSAWPELRERLARSGGNGGNGGNGNGHTADPERFRRMWEYYLQSCAGAFRSRSIQLWQVVFTPTGADQPACRVS
jgi:cyclopropane-fatty-acyl-phospholipid synthase